MVVVHEAEVAPSRETARVTGHGQFEKARLFCDNPVVARNEIYSRRRLFPQTPN
jgi:hypothetical protein